jgi:hypothetical protein
MDLARLRRRLLHTERLAREGATDGERAAARAAAERLRARIGLSTPPPEEDAAAWDEPLTDEVAPQDLPSRATLGAWLDDWAAGRAGAADIAARAARFVDGAVLPHLPPEDPDGVVVEVLLVLAGAQGAWAPSDLAAVHAFLGTPPSATRAGWADWLAHLAGRAQRERRGGAAAKAAEGRAAPERRPAPSSRAASGSG